jgi:outer membrane protein OmpA-like peptidoglycan-associated protein
LQQLIVFLIQNPDLKIEIAAHTDNKGNADYNLKLSQERAKSVADFLIIKGINANRLVAKGYGMTQPIAYNNNPDGSDNAEGRQKNRRIIFKVLAQINSDKNE